MKKQNNADFQTEIENFDTNNTIENATCDTQNLDNEITEIVAENNQDNESHTDMETTEVSQDTLVNESDKVADDNTKNDNINVDSNQIDNSNITDSLQSSTCSLDKKKLDKLKNLFFGAIPFIIAAIVISLFNMGRVRNAYSFLCLALGLIELAISNLIISNRISKACNCKSCERQKKSSIKCAIIYGVAAIGLFGVFIYYMVR